MRKRARGALHGQPNGGPASTRDTPGGADAAADAAAQHQVPYRTSCCGVAIPPPDQPALRQRFWVRLFCGSLGAVFMLGSIFYYAYPDDMEFCWLDCPEVNGTATR